MPAVAAMAARLLLGFPAVAAVTLQHQLGPLLGALRREEATCNRDAYQPSELELEFRVDPVKLTSKASQLCRTLGKKASSWVLQNKAKEPLNGTAIFSRICRQGRQPELVEPLAGILRDPRYICQGKGNELKFGVDRLLLADNSSRLGGKNRFFDAGGSRYGEALWFFTGLYHRRGIVFDEVHVWEAKNFSVEEYWKDVPEQDRSFWEPRIRLHTGVPVSAESGAESNVVERIFEFCKPEDFCAFKLDIDTPQLELALVERLLREGDRTRAALDEFFFEHHVHGLMQRRGWKKNVDGTIADSYEIFTKLREMGVRAHSWI